jgi:trigger factor
LKLEVSVADAAQCRKDFTIEVAADEVQQEFDKTYEAYARHAKVPGFRPGRVPRGVVKQRFSKDIRDEVLGRLLSHALEHALNDSKLHIVGSPQIGELSFKEGEPLRFKASVEFIPHFDLKEYKGLKAVKRVARVTEEDIDRAINQLREGAAQLVPVEDRPAADGDYVSVNLVGKQVEPVAEEDVRADDMVVVIGAAGVHPRFSNNLRGVKAGDVRQFRVNYPEDFHDRNFAGKTLDFTATVVAVRQKELPELDDEFAREVGEFQTLAELRGRVREDLKRDAEYQAELRLRDELLERIISAYDFPLPDSLVEKQTRERLSQLVYTLLRSGVSPQAAEQINWKEHEGEERLRAVRDVRRALIIGRISEAEGISASDAEIEAEVARLASHTREPIDTVRARLTKEGGLASIENRLRYQKVLEVVVESAEITVEEFSENQEAEPASSEAQPSPGSRSAEPS